MNYLRNIVFAGAAIACLTSCAGRQNQSENEADDTFLVGAYADYRTISDEEKNLFDSACSYSDRLVPQSVATQVVAGTNYSFICTDKSENVVKVVVFKPLPNQGEPRVTSVEPVSAYDEMIASVKNGIEDHWQKTSPDEIGVSPVYQYCAPSLGYARLDVDRDGIVELLLGDNMGGESEYAVYDIFTFDAENGAVKHLACGGERDWYNFNGSGIVCRHGSNSAFDSFSKYYRIEASELVELQDEAVQEDLMNIEFKAF